MSQINRDTADDGSPPPEPTAVALGDVEVIVRPGAWFVAEGRVMPHSLQCGCGKLKGAVEHTERANHAVCYCRDCQAFAHFLGGLDQILDERGGSEVVQISPRYVRFSEGEENLACVRLTPAGLVRWYASCCNTPIGNTMATPEMSFVGLLHSCLDGSGSSLGEAFGPIRCWGNVAGAKGMPKPRQVGVPRAILWLLSTLIVARLDGSYKRTPFFDEAGSLIATPRVLSANEHRALMESVDTA